MYESYYGFTAKPFQLKPDPSFFYGSKGHKRAMAYLEYGLSQGEGFIVVTGEVGAGKTTLVQNLFRTLQQESIVAARIVSTQVNAEEILKLVVAGFGLPYEGLSKAALLTSLEQFLIQCGQRGKRALLVVDEAQNLPMQAVEELRMLSNFQHEDNSLLQTFLVGQPEFRKTLLSPAMKQLLQRVFAVYHLGPLDSVETAAYIRHRLERVGWNGAPSISDEGYAAIHEYAGGIPRRINLLCDRLFLMGYLEDLQAFGREEISRVIADISEELAPPPTQQMVLPSPPTRQLVLQDAEPVTLQNVGLRLTQLEKSFTSVLPLIKKLVASLSAVKQPGENLR